MHSSSAVSTICEVAVSKIKHNSHSRGLMNVRVCKTCRHMERVRSDRYSFSWSRRAVLRVAVAAPLLINDNQPSFTDYTSLLFWKLQDIAAAAAVQCIINVCATLYKTAGQLVPQHRLYRRFHSVAYWLYQAYSQFGSKLKDIKTQVFRKLNKNCQNSRILLLSQNSFFWKNFVHVMPEMIFFK